MTYIGVAVDIVLGKSFNSTIIEIDDGKFWIHETQSAIKHEFNIRSIQTSSERHASPKGFAA